MALTSTSRFESVQLRFDTIARSVNWIRYTVVGDPLAQIPYDGLHQRAQNTHQQSQVDTLKAIYQGTGFLDAAGDAVTLQVAYAGGRTESQLKRIGASEDWVHPFKPAISQHGVLTSLGERYYRVRLWQQAATKPADPPANWWDGTDRTLIAALGSWYTSRTSAVIAGSTDPVWFALASVSIGGDDSVIYSPWEVFQEFDVEYSADGTSWHAAQVDGDTYFAFLTPDGFRRVVEIAAPPDLDWTQLYDGNPYFTHATNGHSVSLGGTIDLNLYQRLRFRMLPFGYWSTAGDLINVGAEAQAIVHRPNYGWISSHIVDDTDQFGAMTVQYDETDGLDINPMFGGLYAGVWVAPNGIVRGNDGGGNPLPFARQGFKIRPIGPDTSQEHRISSLRFYDQGTNVSYRRFQLTIWGATY